MEAQIQNLQGLGSGLGVCINRVVLRCNVGPLGHRARYMTLALLFFQWMALLFVKTQILDRTSHLTPTILTTSVSRLEV